MSLAEFKVMSRALGVAVTGSVALHLIAVCLLLQSSLLGFSGGTSLVDVVPATTSLPMNVSFEQAKSVPIKQPEAPRSFTRPVSAAVNALKPKVTIGGAVLPHYVDVRELSETPLALSQLDDFLMFDRPQKPKTWVKLRVWIGPSGGVVDVRALDGNVALDVLDRVALAFRKMRFSPVNFEDGPVGVWGDITVKLGHDATGHADGL